MERKVLSKANILTIVISFLIFSTIFKFWDVIKEFIMNLF